jgi:hypothetical protein
MRRRELLDRARLERTIDRLHGDGVVSEEEARALREELPATLARSGYVLRHLAAHGAIGAVFAFDLIPLPLGTISRVLWVLGSRVYESLFGTRERVRVHSLAVLLIAGIPLAGYGAYLLPLRRESEAAAFLFANHSCYALLGADAEACIARCPRWLRRFPRWLLPPPGPRSVYSADRRSPP